MDHLKNTTMHQKYKHLSLEDRVIIQIRLKDGWTVPEIAKAVGCCPNTVRNEIKRGLKPMYKNKRLCYRAKNGQANYEKNRESCHRNYKILACSKFICHVLKMFNGPNKWSFDAIVGDAASFGRFPKSNMVCTKTLYNELASGNLPLSLFDVPEVLKRKRRKTKTHEHKRLKGRSIDERPAIVEERIELGHWEADTVVGQRNGKEAVVLTLIERVTDHYLAIHIPGKTSEAVMNAMKQLYSEYGGQFSTIFKTITTDNGPEFEDFADVQQWGTDVFFAHPYSSWERAVNERHNGLLRRYIPKGVSMERYTSEDVLGFADNINSLPRKRLGYRTPEELFEDFLDSAYAA